MNEQRTQQDVEVSDGDRPVASADVTTSTDSHGTSRCPVRGVGPYAAGQPGASG